MANKKYIVACRELHLGHIKETFHAGTVIEYDEDKHTLVIDGRTFQDTRDFDVLQRQAEKHPSCAWIIPFAEEALAIIKNSIPRPEVIEKKPSPVKAMKVIKSDADLMSDEIDIRDTKVSKKNVAMKKAARQKAQTEPMEIVRGDESVEERIASLGGKNDIKSMSERVRLKATGSVKMPVVKNDGLGHITGSNVTSLNAGQLLRPRRGDTKAPAAREAGVEAKRAENTKNEEGNIAVSAPTKDAEADELARLAELEGQTSVMDIKQGEK